MILGTKINLATVATPVGPTWLELFSMILAFGFLWLPLFFVAYAIQRRQFGIKFLFAFITAEAAAVALAIYLQPWIFGKS